MTDQPKPDKDETPEGYQPPSYIPAQESDVPAAPTPPATTRVRAAGLRPAAVRRAGLRGRAVPGQAAPGLQPARGSPYGTPSPYAQQPYGQPPYGAPGQQPYGAPALRPAALRRPAAVRPAGDTVNAYGQPAYYGLPPEPKGLSIASLCCGIATLRGTGLLPPAAARRRHPGAHGPQARTVRQGHGHCRPGDGLCGDRADRPDILLISVGLAVGRSTFGTSGA